MRRFKVALLLVVVALGFFCLVRPLLGGEPRPAPELKRRPPAANSQPQGQRNWIPNTGKVNTRLVLLEVVATDKKGQPITDFKAGGLPLVHEVQAAKGRGF